jgi:hypothetical protein
MHYVLGICSLILSTLIVLDLIFRPQDTSGNFNALLVEAAGVFLEIVLIIFVVDQVAEYRERKKWKALHSNIGQTLQRAFVDLVRVNYIFTHPENMDSVRLSEFIDFARFSLSDLRSQIESFTNSLETKKQSHIRSIEKKLNYLFRNFHSLSLNSRTEYGHHNSVNYENYIFFQTKDNWRVLTELSTSIDNFLSEIDYQRDPYELKTAKDSVEQAIPTNKETPLVYERFYSTRHLAQDIALEKMQLKYVLLDETDQTNSLYFCIDRLLLDKLTAVSV